MPTLGSTSEPTTSQVGYGLNVTNHYAVAITMPSGGPWLITDLGAWVRGWNEACDFRICVWSSGGTLLGQTAVLTASNGGGLAVGNNVKYTAGVQGAGVEVNGGQTVYVGVARDPSTDIQFGTRSGTRRQRYSSSWPASLGSYDSVSGAIGAFIQDYESANVAPNAPTSLQPTGSEVVHNATAPVLKGSRSDPDSGDYITKFEVRVYEDDGTTLVYSGTFDVNGTPTTFSKTVSLPASHRYYRWKARTWDKNGLAGPYSALQRFYANAVPATPPAPTVDNDSITPVIAGGFSDSGDTLASVEIDVDREYDPVFWEEMWDSGTVAKSGTSWTHTYNGPALIFGVNYRFRYRVIDSHGGESALSPYTYVVPVQPLGPTNNTPRTTTPRLSSLTPTLTVGHNATFRNDEVQVRSAAAGGGSLLWSKTWDGVDYAVTTTKARVYAGTALTYGQRVWWRSRIELADGTISEWSAWHEIRINAEPTAPVALAPSGGIGINDTTPQLRARFSDPDTDQGDTPSLVTLEVRNNVTDALVFSQTGVAPSPGVGEDGQTYDHRVSTTALTNETVYKWRIRFTDAMGRQGPFSAYQVFKISSPPVATSVGPASPVTESTPLLDWGFSSPGGKTQYSYRVKVFDKGPSGALSYQQQMLALSPLLYMRMGGNPLTELGSATGLTLTPTGSPLLEEPGLLTRDEDTAVLFDGVNDWVAVVNMPVLVAGGMTLAAWGRTTEDKAEYLLARGSNGYLRRIAGGRITFSWFDGGGVQRTLNTPLTGPHLLLPDETHFVVGVHDGVNTARIYVDGVEVASTTAFTGWSAPGAGQWGIGANNAGSADWWKGTIDEVAIWNTPLDASSIAALYESGTNPANYPNEVQVYDSGEVVSAATAHDLPFGVLLNSHDYRWEVTVKDTDMLTHTLT